MGLQCVAANYHSRRQRFGDVGALFSHRIRFYELYRNKIITVEARELS